MSHGRVACRLRAYKRATALCQRGIHIARPLVMLRLTTDLQDIAQRTWRQRNGTSCWLAGGGDGSPSSAMRAGVAAALPGAGLTPRLGAAPGPERMDGDAPDVTPGVRPGVSPGALPGVSMKPLLCSSLAVGAATRSACRTPQIPHCMLIVG